MSSDATHYPLLPMSAFRSDAVIAWHHGDAITMQRFLHDATRLAARLPARGHAMNLCDNPYLFMLSFAAVLLRGHTNVLPPNRLPDVIRHIADRYEHCYLLSDSELSLSPQDAARLPVIVVNTPDAPFDAHVLQEPPPLSALHTAAILFTSGSTGEPVAYPKPWRTLVLGAAANARASIPAGSHPALVGTVPSQHSYGLETLVMLPLQGHGSVLAARPFFPDDIAHALAALPAPRVLVTTPVHLRALINAATALPPLQSIWSATAPLSRELAEAVEQCFDAPLHEIFGCTEAGTFATRRTVRESDWTLLQQFSLQRTADQTLIAADHLPMFPVLQDQIEQPDPRHFRLLGRGADLINIAGKRASLADLNHKLLSIAGVQDGVIFLPDAEDAGQTTQRTAAFVVAPTLTREQVLAALRQLIDAAFVPRPLYIVPRLPRNDVSKLPRRALLQLLSELRHET